MRSSTIARPGMSGRLSSLLCILCAVLLACSLIPHAAFAAQTSLELIPEGSQGAVRIASGAEGGEGSFSHCAADPSDSVDAGSAAISSEDADDTDDALSDGTGSVEDGSVDAADPSVGAGSVNPAEGAERPSEIINQQMPLDTLVAQTESTKSYLLAQTLETTKTVPIVTAKLPLDMGANNADADVSVDATTDGEVVDGDASDEGIEGSEDSDESDLGVDVVAPGISAGSTVVGSFEYLGMTFAVEPGGETVVLVATDRTRLQQEFIDAQVIAVPDVVSLSANDLYSVTRIADDAFNIDVSESDMVTLGEEREEISQAEIGKCDPTIIMIPDSVVEINENAFRGWSTLKSIIVSRNNSVYSSYGGCLYDKEYEILLYAPAAVSEVVIHEGCKIVDVRSLVMCFALATIYAPASVTLVSYDLQVDECSEAGKEDRSLSNAFAWIASSPKVFQRHTDRNPIKVVLLNNADRAYWKMLGFYCVEATSIDEERYSLLQTELSLVENESFLIEGQSSSGAVLGYAVDADGGVILSFNAADMGSPVNSFESPFYSENWPQYSVNGAYLEYRYPSPDNRLWRYVAYDVKSNSFSLGWSNEPNGSALPNGYQMQGYETLYALWENYTIDYELAGGHVESDLKEAYRVVDGDIVLPTPIKSGYFFLGWTGSNGSEPQTVVTIPKGSVGNRTYTANWAERYEVTLHTEGGSIVTSGWEEWEAEQVYHTYRLETTNDIVLPTPIKSGYFFLGWTGSNGSEPQTVVTIPKGSVGNRTYTANWAERISVSVPLMVGVAVDPATGETKLSEGARILTTNPSTVEVVGLRYDLVEPEDDLDGSGSEPVTGGGTRSIFSDESGTSHLDEVFLTVAARRGSEAPDAEVPAVSIPLAQSILLDKDALASAGFEPFSSGEGDGLSLSYGLAFSKSGDDLTKLLGRLNLPAKNDDNPESASDESYPFAKLFYTIELVG